MYKYTRVSAKIIMVSILLLCFFAVQGSVKAGKSDTPNVKRLSPANDYSRCMDASTLMNTIVFTSINDITNPNNLVHLSYASNFSATVVATDPRFMIPGDAGGIIKYNGGKSGNWTDNFNWSGGPITINTDGSDNADWCSNPPSGDLLINDKGSSLANFWAPAPTGKAMVFYGAYIPGGDLGKNFYAYKLVCSYWDLGGQNMIFDFQGVGTPSGIDTSIYEPVGWDATWGKATIGSDGQDSNEASTVVFLRYNVKKKITEKQPSTTITVTDYEKGVSSLKINYSVTRYFDRAPDTGSCPNIIVAYISGGPDSDKFVGLTRSAINGNSCSYIGSIDINASNFRDKPPGFRYTYTISYGSATANGSGIVFQVPYSRVYGGDVFSNNDINFPMYDTRVKSTFQSNSGALSQYAAMFKNFKTGLPTSGLRSAVANRTQGNDGLDSKFNFSNIDFNEVSGINKNLPDDCEIRNNSSTVFTTSFGNNVCYKYVGHNITTPYISYSNKITIKSDSDIIIHKDIINNTSDFSNPKNTGVMLIIAKNIKIDKNVKRIDAILVASENIDTCDVSNNIGAQCKDPLVINGSIAANNIKLKRISGSRLLGTDGNNGGFAGSKNIEAYNNNLDDKAAEIVNFPVYLYFAKPYLQSDTRSGALVDEIYSTNPRR
ncbi:hypothetical protein KBC85_02330 [Candidatus Saccharibacteria bacterium]|nr:hypothetical protein [Candidatus Saccharibacteria bacterium]